jgi:hypothetical protein
MNHVESEDVPKCSTYKFNDWALIAILGTNDRPPVALSVMITIR